MKHNAWHFVGNTLRDGTLVPANGVTLVYDKPLKLCASGYHAGYDPFDALTYAPGSTLCKVYCAGEVVESDDKLVCTERTIICKRDVTGMLRLFARQQALSVIDKWDAPDVVKQYLQTGDEFIREAAWSAARSAAWSAAYLTARETSRKMFNEMVNKEFGTNA